MSKVNFSDKDLENIASRASSMFKDEKSKRFFSLHKYKALDLISIRNKKIHEFSKNNIF
jgi:hypothetical protein